MSFLLLLQLSATLLLTGIIWFVQLVHYPLFPRVGAAGFAAYERAHTRLISPLVAPAMLVEASTAVLFVWVRPSFVPPAPAWLGLALVAAIWLSTFLAQVPQHRVLAAGFDAAAHRRLAAGNWIRTICWSVRAVLLVLLVERGLAG